MATQLPSVCRRNRRSTAVRIEDLARVRDWVEREIVYVAHDAFQLVNAAAHLRRTRPASLDQQAEPANTEPGIAFVSGMVESPLLTLPEEVYLFQWMNYLKYRAEQTRQRLCLNSPDLSFVEQIECDMAEAVCVRNRIVRSNLRLVVSLAKKLAGNMDQMSELIAEATIPLIRSVELFDVSLGNRFSTYATWAVRNHMLRCLKRRQQALERTVAHDELWLNRLPDERSNPDDDVRLTRQRSETVERLLSNLSDRERLVIVARFGLDGQPRGQSLQHIADNVGLSKERVRQILIRAVEKLQGVIGSSNEAFGS